MSAEKIHLAAVFDSITAAETARAALVAAGVPASAVLLLDRGERMQTAPKHIWGRLKARLLPDHHAHHYAEAITRGHPLLLADIDAAQRDAALAALATGHPVDLQAQEEAWRAAGWDGTYEGEEAWEAGDKATPGGSDGLVGGDLIAGDYGAVGAPLGGTWVDTDIRRGTVRLYRAP